MNTFDTPYPSIGQAIALKKAQVRKRLEELRKEYEAGRLLALQRAQENRQKRA
jgi:hypothetical protein